MKQLNRFNKIFILGLMLTAPVMGVNKNAGTSGAEFLKIGAGARPAAMGGAFVGLADDVNAVYYNPAGLSFIARPEFIGMQTQWFEGMSYNFGAFMYPTSYGAFALSAQTLNVSDIEKRASDETQNGTFESQDAAYAFSYSRYMGPQLSLGLTGRYIKQELDTEEATALSADVGLLKKFGRLPLSLGIAAKHFGEEIKFRNESDPLPFSLDIGLGANLYRDRLILAFDTKMPRDNDLTLGGGLEFNTMLSSDFKISFRSGFNSSMTDADASGLSIGGGISVGHFNGNFAWIPMGDLGDTFRYDIQVKF